MIRFSSHNWLFGSLLASFAVIYLAFYPATFAIADEAEILTLAFSLAHGTIHPDVAGVRAYNVTMEYLSRGHRVVKYSVFHAALLVPAVRADWRLVFLVTAAFFAAGAFIVRAMLRERDLSGDWSILYFLLAGPLYYASTIEAAVPAAVMGLLGAAMLLRKTPRPCIGGLALGAAVLLHPWMSVFAGPLAASWWIERERSEKWRDGLWLALGAFPSIIVIGAYDLIVNGDALRVNYAMTGELAGFYGAHFFAFAPFYVLSLLIFPIAGWAALSPRWSRGWAIPATTAAIVICASLYGYRDGLTSGLGGWRGTIFGAIPGQRFLLPASMLACVPAADWLQERVGALGLAWSNTSRAAALAVFIAAYGILGGMHQGFLRANAVVQQAISAAVPSGAALVGEGAILKELAPVNGIISYRSIDDADSSAGDGRDYVAWLVAPGAAPPALMAGRRVECARARSWIWNRDLWIGWPRSAAAGESEIIDSAAHPSPDSSASRASP